MKLKVEVGGLGLGPRIGVETGLKTKEEAEFGVVVGIGG